MSLPVFNTPAKLWYSPHKPALDLPDRIGVMVQVYIASKGYLDITPGTVNAWVPPIYIRFEPAASPLDLNLWIVGVVEPISFRDLYYRIRWKEWMHPQFPNQYQMAIVEQCDGLGAAIIRDVP